MSTGFQLYSCSLQSHLDIRTENVYKTFIASDNNLRYLFSLNARRKLNIRPMYAQFDNVLQLHVSLQNHLLHGSAQQSVNNGKASVWKHGNFNTSHHRNLKSYIDETSHV